MKKLIGAIAALALLAGVAIIGVPIAVVLVGAAVLDSDSSGQSDVCAEGGSPSLVVDLAGLPSKVLDLTDEQIENAAIILATAQEMGMDQRAQLIGLMTAMQESTLVNLEDGDRDSIGLFQQRPSMGWGSPEELHDPTYAARAFFQGVPDKGIPGLKDIQGWEKMPFTQAAQAVQQSGYPDAYAQHEAKAMKIMAALAGVDLVGASDYLTDNTIGCDATDLPLSAAPDGLPTQEQLLQPSAGIACPEGTVDLGPGTGGAKGKKIPIRLCSIPGTVCTGTDCGVGTLGGKARGEVVINSLVAPHFIAWLNDVRVAGHNPTFVSSFRSWESQERISRGGTNPNAADPGKSNHQMGAALDIAGLPGSYSRHNCAGNTEDGSCKANSAAWQTYWQAGIAHGALVHDEEFWHLEWVITRAEQRNIPWAQDPAPTAALAPDRSDFGLAA
ncbi:D-alanyl-D-alanine carboxypeptidase family protein [Brachybacterium sp. Marseille-Q7125]|uniref:D-alanyl-D-alanine carboxypeptidase family protein n=1 Tax=Brachybacterium sp. Marseille-Q7125 TaxID=2932815 RepID=UPI001FF1A05E|nr:D-alanyl-D-alanine carboxypeptidase family protein [Brachybacterium sp. Marseille-Q7125]